MRRRDLLRLGATLPAALAARGVRGQPSTITRAAVVIGVDRPADLTPLRAAADGAKKVGDWLEDEGFDVQRFSDNAKPVKAAEIFDAIEGFVNLGTLQQLVVYFAGHGCFVGSGEYWLLSQALHNPNEAISVNECLNLSRQCGIPSVVLISDACRSTSASLNIQQLHGYVIFPVINNRNVFTYLDRFLAVRIGAPAYEVKDTAGKYDGIYTSCFLDAYSYPDDRMLEEVNGFRVVPNKKLEDYLLREVPKRAEISNVQQYPDSVVTSSNYIGRAVRREGRWRGWRGPSRGCAGCFGCVAGSAPEPERKVVSAPLTINNLSEFELSRFGIQIRTTTSKDFSAAALQKIAKDTGFAATRASILSARGPNVFKYATGINVFGIRLRKVISPNMEAEILREGDGLSEAAIVQIDPRDRRQDGVALEFEDGSGTVIAALRGYVAKVVVEGGRVISVSYAPAIVGDKLRVAQSSSLRADRLRALVATSAKFGVFRIDGPPETRSRNAKQLADAIRVEKPLDPTLAMYAAYAYADAGLSEQIRALHKIMKTELGIDLFDVAMLAGEPVETQAPFCPMLSQGWQLLTGKTVTLARQFTNARNHLLDALWTTFDREGMSMVKSALDTPNLR